MNIKHAKDSILTLLEVVENSNILFIVKNYGSIITIMSMDEFPNRNLASSTIEYNANKLILGTIHNEKDIHKYMGLEVQYMYLPSSLDSELSKWMITKLRGNNLFIYDDWG